MLMILFKRGDLTRPLARSADSCAMLQCKSSQLTVLLHSRGKCAKIIVIIVKQKVFPFT